MPLHDLILITASAVMGFTAHVLLVLWADRRAKPMRDGWEQATEYARKCDLREAYRQGQSNPQYIEAPTPQNLYYR